MDSGTTLFVILTLYTLDGLLPSELLLTARYNFGDFEDVANRIMKKAKLAVSEFRYVQ